MSKGLGVLIRRGVAAMASAALLSAALQGCGGDDTDDTYDPGLPSESELTTSTPTPTPTPTDPTTPVVTGPQEPALPDAAMGQGKKGAKAFVAYYIKLLNYASWTGDTRAVRAYGRGCRGCRVDAEFFERIYDHGGWIKGGRWTPVAGSWIALPRHPGWFVGLNIDASKGLQRMAKKAEVERVLAERLHRDFHLVRDGDEWHVTYMEAEL